MSIKHLSYLLSLTIFLLFSCTGSKKTISSDAVDDGKIEVVIFQINDVYEIAPLEGGSAGGMARVATFYKQLKKQNPNTLFVHAGDFLNPSVIGTMKYEGSRINGKHMVEVMNQSGVDLVVFGNHEFDLKPAELQKRINESTFEWLGTNVLHITDGKAVPFVKEMEDGTQKTLPNTYQWQVKDADGTSLSIGIFGAIIASNPVDYVVYNDHTDEVLKYYGPLQKSNDLVLGLTHLSMEEDIELAKHIPNVPLIMGGHEHQHMKHKSLNTVIAKADANAKTAYLHTINYDKKTNKATIDSRLIPMDESVALDPKVDQTVQKWSGIALESFRKSGFDPDKVVAMVDIPLDGRESTNRYYQTNLGALITKAMLQTSKKPADAAIVNSGSIRIDDQLFGEVTQYDIIRVLPFGGAIYEIDINGKLLTTVLNESNSKKGNGAFLQMANITFDETKNQWLIKDKPIQNEKVYHLMTSDFLLTGLDIESLNEDAPGLVSVMKPDKNDATDLRNDIRIAIIHFLENRN